MHKYDPDAYVNKASAMYAHNRSKYTPCALIRAYVFGAETFVPLRPGIRSRGSISPRLWHMHSHIRVCTARARLSCTYSNFRTHSSPRDPSCSNRTNSTGGLSLSNRAPCPRQDCPRKSQRCAEGHCCSRLYSQLCSRVPSTVFPTVHRGIIRPTRGVVTAPSILPSRSKSNAF